MEYYDPKTDVVFKKIFGEHKNLTISLLNAVLQFDGDDKIKDVEYLTSELIPPNDGRRCSNRLGVAVGRRADRLSVRNQVFRK